MTLFYSTSTWSSQPQPTEKTVETWKHASTKSNWRIVQLPNGFYQTEIKIPDEDSWKDITRRETIEGAEAAIEASIEYYNKKLGFLKGPKVVKTFE
jgi:major membrane immunogen (membrane-anchored lipoprotein)